MKTRQIGTLTTLIAAALVLANIGPAFADAKTSNDRYTVNVLEKKQAKEAAKMIKALEEYKNTLKQHKLDNKNTEKRIVDKTNSIGNKITGIVSMLRNEQPASNVVSNTPTVEIVKVNKIKGSLSNDVGIARVIYKVTADAAGASDTKVVIDSGVDKIEQQIRNLSATKSTVHTVYMKVDNPNSVSILVTR